MTVDIAIEIQLKMNLNLYGIIIYYYKSVGNFGNHPHGCVLLIIPEFVEINKLNVVGEEL